MAARKARDLSFVSTAQRPKQQGLSVMLTNALRSNSSFRFERNILPTKRPHAVILPIGGNAEVAGRGALGANKFGVRKLPFNAPHPLVAITPGDRFRRRMVRSTGMTAEIVQETGSERIEYRFQGACSSPRRVRTWRPPRGRYRSRGLTALFAPRSCAQVRVRACRARVPRLARGEHAGAHGLLLFRSRRAAGRP